jgi:hypothetical protein
MTHLHSTPQRPSPIPLPSDRNNFSFRLSTRLSASRLSLRLARLLLPTPGTPVLAYAKACRGVHTPVPRDAALHATGCPKWDARPTTPRKLFIYYRAARCHPW